jgi:hypothetical protein
LVVRHSRAGRLRQVVRSFSYNTRIGTVIQRSKSVIVAPSSTLWLHRRATISYIMKPDRPLCPLCST